MSSSHPKSPRNLRAAAPNVPSENASSSKEGHTPQLSPSSEPLPPGWVKQYDPVSQRDFYVDTAIPRSTWCHPYKDEQYLRERRRDNKQNIRRHSSASQGIVSPVILGSQRERCANGEPAKKKVRLATTSPKSATEPIPHDIGRELDFVLHREFSFPGKYCHAATSASAANPGLNVEGIGILGLPLSERDAKLVQSLVASSTKTAHPFKNVWELPAGDVQCCNPAWSAYLEDIVVKDIWKKLAPHCSRPRLVLQSLLLWEASSDVTEYNCTDIPNRTSDEFATIHVILPSCYTGGNVQLSFAGCSENYDLSATSSFSTSLVAWYHGVDCVVKMVESGRRLALSYRLLAGDEGIRPSLPSMPEKLDELRRFFRKWSDIQEYTPDSVPSIIAYPLLHEYRDDDLRADILKLEDRHKVIHLKALCDELGFQLGLATLDDHHIGSADESSTRDGQGRPRMLRVNTRRLTIKEVLDFDGVPLPGLTKLELDETNVVKTHIQPESAPDLVVYDSKDPHVIEFHYSRTIVVLFERRRTVEALLHTRRTPYAMERLHSVDRRRSSPVDKKIVAYVLDSLYRQQPYNFNAQTTLAEVALSWHDAKLWNDVARSTCSHGSLISALDSLKWLDAWRRFSFAAVRESLEHCYEIKGPQKCLEFFLDCDPDAFMSVERGTSLDGVLRWSSEQLTKSLGTLQSLERTHAPLFCALVRQKGIQYFWHVVVPPIIRVPNACEFWMEFLRSVHSLRAENTRSEEDESTFISLSDEGLATIISDFNLVIRSGDISLRSRRLSEIIDLCLSTRRLDMCRRVLFLTVPHDQGADWVPDLLNPFYIPNLRRTLREHNIEVYHKPFIDFFRAAIGCYLQYVLGPFSGELRRICSSCNVCSALDDFMVSPKLTQAHFIGSKTHTSHIQSHLVPAADLVASYTLADPAVEGGNVLIVNKNLDAETDPQWRARKNRGLEFLVSVGEMAIVDRIMGKRANDVALALEGKMHFVHLEDGSRAGNNPTPARRVAIHQMMQGRWVATSLADG
ncbi:WW domain-containing protein [Favolaschia claudopus]|uniref:WW domain-containing protein n=1 Tax=Favolaschia claudopus TaxID=2862362 RepID=A0AAW0CDD3_9AGAR